MEDQVETLGEDRQNHEIADQDRQHPKAGGLGLGQRRGGVAIGQNGQRNDPEIDRQREPAVPIPEKRGLGIWRPEEQGIGVQRQIVRRVVPFV